MDLFRPPRWHHTAGGVVPREPVRSGSVPAMARIAFLGLGRMGALMAARLVAAGHDLTVWNRTASRTAPLVEAGAAAAATPAEAVEGAEIVITMLADPTAVTEVLAAAGPALAPGTVLVEMSTVGPDAVRALRALLPESVRLVDAPVQGSLPQARAGELKIVAGGDEKDIAAVSEPLSVLGTVNHVGPVGAGAAAKLVINTVTVSSMVLIGEALALADRLGLETGTALDALAGTAVGPMVNRVRDRLATPDAPTQFALGLAEKDLGLVLDAGADADGVIGGARARMAAGKDHGLADRDFSAVVGYLRDAAR
jgi:3-hydroxyisobutyrate dehydrogenase-like beta-hydroxyacid dehydrogenase